MSMHSIAFSDSFSRHGKSAIGCKQIEDKIAQEIESGYYACFRGVFSIGKFGRRGLTDQLKLIISIDNQRFAVVGSTVLGKTATNKNDEYDLSAEDASKQFGFSKEGNSNVLFGCRPAKNPMIYVVHLFSSDRTKPIDAAIDIYQAPSHIQYHIIEQSCLGPNNNNNQSIIGPESTAPIIHLDGYKDIQTEKKPKTNNKRKIRKNNEKQQRQQQAEKNVDQDEDDDDNNSHLDSQSNNGSDNEDDMDIIPATNNNDDNNVLSRFLDDSIRLTKERSRGQARRRHAADCLEQIDHTNKRMKMGPLMNDVTITNPLLSRSESGIQPLSSAELQLGDSNINDLLNSMGIPDNHSVFANAAFNLQQALREMSPTVNYSSRSPSFLLFPSFPLSPILSPSNQIVVAQGINDNNNGNSNIDGLSLSFHDPGSSILPSSPPLLVRSDSLENWHIRQQ